MAKLLLTLVFLLAAPAAWAAEFGTWTEGKSGTGSADTSAGFGKSISLLVPNGTNVADETPQFTIASTRGGAVYLDANVADKADAAGSIAFMLYECWGSGAQECVQIGTLDKAINQNVIYGLAPGRYKLVCTVAYAGAETGLVFVKGI